MAAPGGRSSTSATSVAPCSASSQRLARAFTIDVERREDERGFFARTWDAEELAARGLDARAVQSSIAYNRLAGTVRGLHYQKVPFAETKLVRCTAGAIWDVVVDLRR